MNDKIKIVHIVEWFTGGVKKYLCDILPRLVEREFDVTLICSLGRKDSDWKEWFEKLKQADVEIKVVWACRAVNPLIDIISFVQIIWILMRGRYDVVHSHCSKAGVLGRVAGLAMGAKVVHCPHCFAFLRGMSGAGKWLAILCEKLLGKVSWCIVAVGKFDIEAIQKYSIAKRFRYVPNAVGEFDIEATSDSSFDALFGETARVVLTACRLVEYKGVERFVRAAKICKADNVIFAIAGDGECRGKISALIEKFDVGDRVKLLGYVSDMDSLYRRADLAVLCSDGEGMPYFLLEAMNAKCAVIGSNVGGIRELIEDSKAGMLCRNHEEEIAAGIDKMLACERLRDMYVRNAMEMIEARHRHSRQIEGLVDIYLKAVKSTKKDYANIEYTTV